MNTYTHPPHGHAYTNRNAHTRKHAHTLHTSPLIDGFSISLLATGLGTDTECCYKIRSEIIALKPNNYSTNSSGTGGRASAHASQEAIGDISQCGRFLPSIHPHSSALGNKSHTHTDESVSHAFNLRNLASFLFEHFTNRRQKKNYAFSLPIILNFEKPQHIHTPGTRGFAQFRDRTIWRRLWRRRR